jgi:branched-chain amino acid transport system permease protein
MLTAGCGAGLAAVVLQRVAYHPLRNQPKINVLLTGIGVSILLQNLGLKFFGARSRGVPPVDLPIPAKVVAVCILVASLTLLWVLVEKTLLGVKMRAVAESSEKAELCGIRPGQIYAITFFIGGGFAGIGAVVWGIVYGNINPQMGFELGLKAFIISVIGGIGSLPGTCTAAIAMGIADKLLETYLPADFSGYKQAFLLLILLAILIIKPRGLVRTPWASEGNWS